MDTQFRSQVVFHLTGRPLEPAAPVTGLRPALLAAYRDLHKLRYDFPLILSAGGADRAQSLSSVVDRALRGAAPEGIKGEGMRRRALAVEREIRRRAAAGTTGQLSQLWDQAAAALAPAGDEAFLRDVNRVKSALGVDGEVADCNWTLPARLIRHEWAAEQGAKARRARERIDSLVIRLDDILRADRQRSPAALQKPALQASFGATPGLFDFDAMSRLLSRATPHGGLIDARRRRVESALSVLRSQRFFAPVKATVEASHPTVHGFHFDSVTAALDAFRNRMPELVDLLRALQLAELEADGTYVEALHDPVLGAIDASSVSAQDLEFFPDYLVCLSGEESDRSDTAHLAEALSSGVPVKVLVQVDDLLEEGPAGQGRFAFGVRSAQLASSIMSLGDVFVLQTAASNMLQTSDRIRQGLRYPGPALFSVYAAPAAAEHHMPGYLDAAAAMQSRAFPAFSYDPGAGPDLAARFSLENNPQVESDWPVERFSYADPDLQAVTEEVAFTFVDFVACDSRYARHFAPVPRAAWSEGMVPVPRWLESPTPDASSGVPYILAVDDGNLLCRLVVDDRLIRAAQRCRDAWRRLQEMAGIHDVRAERRLAREREAWEAEHREAQAQAAEAPQAAAEPAAAGPAAAAPAAVEAEPARNPDEAYIETIRCSTCNECTQAFPKMFAYNENKQAYIANLKAGTYRQLVEAAESCQVSVIHPGKPWDPNEPGLEELIERARPFL